MIQTMGVVQASSLVRKDKKNAFLITNAVLKNQPAVQTNLVHVMEYHRLIAVINAMTINANNMQECLLHSNVARRMEKKFVAAVVRILTQLAEDVRKKVLFVAVVFMSYLNNVHVGMSMESFVPLQIKFVVMLSVFQMMNVVQIHLQAAVQTKHHVKIRVCLKALAVQKNHSFAMGNALKKINVVNFVQMDSRAKEKENVAHHCKARLNLQNADVYLKMKFAVVTVIHIQNHKVAHVHSLGELTAHPQRNAVARMVSALV